MNNVHDPSMGDVNGMISLEATQAVKELLEEVCFIWYLSLV